MRADSYYGTKARNYDAARQDGVWRAEQALIEKLVTEGPVLDVPFGTGRYVPIYERKGLDYLGIDLSEDMLTQARRKFPQAKCERGTVFDLPAGFKTSVTTRLLNWLYPTELQAAMTSLTRAADTLIFSLRAGQDGDRRGTATYTHSTTTLKRLIGGRLWEQHHIGNLAHGEYIMVKARRPTWTDFVRAFADRPKGTLEKLTREWSARLQLEPPELNASTPLTVEWWTQDDLATYLDRAIESDPGMRVKRQPRRTDLPMVAFKRQGKVALLDGRCRATLWQNQRGLYPMIVAVC